MADIYVRKNGNDSTGTGLTGAPYLTLTKALTVVAGGDTIIMGTGTYNENTINGYLRLNKAFSSLVTIQSETGKPADVLVQGASGTSAEVFVQGAGNVKFKDMTFSNRDATVIYVFRFGAPTSFTLNGAINASQTTITANVSTNWVPPASGGFNILVDTERMAVTAISGNTWTVTRGTGGTTAATHSSGATLLGHIMQNFYLENCVINVVGTSSTLCYGVYGGYALDMSIVQNFSMNNCTINGPGGTYSGASPQTTNTGGRITGVYFRPTVSATYYVMDNLSFTNCTILTGHDGIRCEECTNVTVRNNYISTGGDGFAHCVLIGIDGSGGRAASGIVENNYMVITASHGMEMGYGVSSGTVRNNWLVGGSDVNNGQGMVLKSCDSVQCYNNFIVGGYQSGLYFKAATNCTAHHNTVTYAYSPQSCLRSGINTGVLKVQNLNVRYNRFIATVGKVIIWEGATGDAGGCVNDYNTYAINGSSTLGTVRSANISSLSDLTTAWSAYDVTTNDSHSILDPAAATIDYTHTASNARLYCVFINGSSQYLNVSNSTFETYNASNWTLYGFLMGEIVASSKNYSIQVPLDLASGTYTGSFYRQAVGNYTSATTDPKLANFTIVWTGSVITKITIAPIPRPYKLGFTSF